MFNHHKKDLGTHFLLLLVSIIWGSSWAAGRILSNGLDADNPASMGPATSAWLRYLIVNIMFYIWYIYKFFNKDKVRFLPPDNGTLYDMMLLGLFGVMIYQLCFMHGMKWTAAGDASLIMPINPIFTVLLAYLFLGQRITKKIVAGMGLSVIGVIIIVGWSPNTNIPLDERIIGDFMIMIAALSWAISSIITKRTMDNDIYQNISPSEIVVWYSLIGWVMLTPWMIYELIFYDLPSPNITELITILYLASFSTVIAYVWFVRGIEKLGPTVSSTYIFLVPIFGILGGWIILNENIGTSMILGFILVVIGVRSVQIESNRLDIKSK